MLPSRPRAVRTGADRSRGAYRRLAVERHGEQLFLVQRPQRFGARNNAPAARAIDLTSSSSVLDVGAREGASPRNMYGTNAESGGPGALDPSINIWDLGEDPLAWGKDRIVMLKELLNDLPSKLLADKSSYADLTSA